MISNDLQSYTVTTIANNSRLSSVQGGIRFGLANSIIKAHTGLAKTEYKIQNDNKNYLLHRHPGVGGQCLRDSGHRNCEATCITPVWEVSGSGPGCQS